MAPKSIEINVCTKTERWGVTAEKTDFGGGAGLVGPRFPEIVSGLPRAKLASDFEFLINL